RGAPRTKRSCSRSGGAEREHLVESGRSPYGRDEDGGAMALLYASLLGPAWRDLAPAVRASRRRRAGDRSIRGAPGGGVALAPHRRPLPNAPRGRRRRADARGRAPGRARALDAVLRRSSSSDVAMGASRIARRVDDADALLLSTRGAR